MITDRIYQLYKILGFDTITEFELSIPVSQGVISKAHNKKTYISSKWIELLAEKYPINGHWLLTGKGNPLLNNNQDYPPSAISNNIVSEELVHYKSKKDLITIPVVDEDQILKYKKHTANIQDRTILIPELQNRGDFVIQMYDDSMLPKYSSGSYYICKYIDEKNIIDWGKIFILSSKNGVLLKRLHPSAEDEDSVLCVSDNDKIPSFNIKKDLIQNFFIVIGVFSIES